MSKQINKITTGFITQSYEDDQVVNCGFTAGDQVEYETPFGEPCDGPENEQYFGFDMLQPGEISLDEEELKIVRYALSFLDCNVEEESVAEDLEEKGIKHSALQELLKSIE